MAKTVNSVLGPISPDSLGLTLIHEHLVCGYPGWQSDTAAPPYDRKKAAEICVEAIREVQQYGLKTLVDATANDLSRDPELYKMVAEKTGVNIICATGLYKEEEGSAAYFKARAAYSGNPPRIVNEMYETFMKDITEGIGGSGVKAGIIKVATSKETITPYEEMVMEAAVMAQKDTGVPIFTHTEAGTMGPQQADFLIGKGADASRLMVGHMCGNSDVQYHQEVLQKGTFISFDRFGLNIFMPDTIRTNTLIDLLGKGYEKQIMLSHDCIINWLGRDFGSLLPEPVLPLVADWNLTNIFKNILPALKKANITDEQINTLMVDNPRRFFAGE